MIDLRDPILTAALLLGALVTALPLVVRVARGSGLGWAHPVAVWTVLHLVFFGLGAAILPWTEGRATMALYVAGGLVAFALGATGSAALAAARRDPEVAARIRDHAGRAMAGPLGTVVVAPPPVPVRLPVAAILAALGIALLVPTFVASGIPFLTADPTGSRVEIAGLIVQPLRVALPALALALVLRARRRGMQGPPLAIAVLGVLAIAGFELLLATRYLLAELAAVLVLGWLIAGGRLPGRVVAAIAAVGLVGFVGIGLVRAWDLARDDPVGFVVDRTVSRVALVQPRTLDALIRVIPAEEDHFGGLTWLRRLGPLVGRDDIPNLGYWIYPEVVPGAQATAGYAAPGLIGEAWANFGWPGLALLALLGVAAERLGALIVLRGPGTADVVGGALATLWLARTHALGLVGLGVLVVLTIAWRVLVARDAGLGRDVRAVLAWRA